MNTETINIVDQNRKLIAIAQVAECGDRLAGRIDLSIMPDSVRKTFEEYEGIVNNQVFALLDDVEDHINALGLKAEFANGNTAALEDLQIYPGTGRVSFRIVHEPDNGTMQMGGDTGFSAPIPPSVR